MFTRVALVMMLVCCGTRGLADDFKPRQDSLPVVPPEKAIILFDGDKTNLFLNKQGGMADWKIEDGALVSSAGNSRSNHIVSKWHFRDADIHAEFLLPESGPGNSGLYIHGNYELQIFNSSGKENLSQDDIGAVYGFAKPLVNAGRKPGEWQVYDIRYQAPRRDADGKITEEGMISAWLNGQQVQSETRFGEPRSKFHPYIYNTSPYLQTIWGNQKRTMVGPLFLQDHDSPVRFRNVWIVPRDDLARLYEP